MAQLHDLTMLEQAAAIRRREISPVDLVDHYLERIDRLNETVGAFVHSAPPLPSTLLSVNPLSRIVSSVPPQL